MRAALILAVWTVALPALARAQDDPACAKFEEPLAYNACLASHGPPARDIGATPGTAGVHQADPEGAAVVGAPKPERRAAAHVAPRRGRVHMEFRIR